MPQPMILINDHLSDLNLDEALQQMSAQRRTYLLGFGNERARREGAAAYLLLCQALRQTYGITAPPVFSFGQHGKPFMAEHPDIHFSLSHCREAVACGVSDKPIGIDIETPRSFSPALLAKVMSQAEADAILTDENPQLAFSRLWTRKEAVFKLTGTGITDDIRTVLTTMKQVDVSTVVSPDGRYVYSIATYNAAADIYAELEEALSQRPDYPRVYGGMSRIFRRCLNERCGHTQMTFGGDFAKMAYLLKRYEAPSRLVRAMNETRVRFRQASPRGLFQTASTTDELEAFCLYDLKNLCEFIALVYQCDIPSRLSALLPSDTVPEARFEKAGDCIRAVVEHWDDEYVYVQTDEPIHAGRMAKVCYAHGNTTYDFDWSYLKDLFHAGAQLNLVRPRERDGVVYPELIIYEPDYLVNISTVAHCFTNYADSAYVELIHKLEPQVNTEATILGNFASQLLDEAIHHLPPTHTYRQSIEDFFSTNAIKLLTAEIGPQFHTEAHLQQQHIAKAINQTLPEAVAEFDTKKGIVEPSFFSEMLGLQGRMDYLQLDFKVLMEQKSGKGSFPYNNFVSPRHTEEHYVQLLLYIALIRYNYRNIYEHNKGINAFLLYSKYSESLHNPGSTAPELLFRAFKVRNELAWTELSLTRPDGYKILDTLTPDQLNEKGVRNSLWVNWQRPQIATVLDAIQQASALEKAYFFRFMTFIANEHVMSKLGNGTKENSGFAASWRESLQEKRLAGNIYDQLTLVSPNDHTAGRIQTVELQFADTADNDLSNFRIGDIVILYPYPRHAEPDLRRTMVHRCTIEAIGVDTIRLALRAAQTDSRVFLTQQDSLWAIEHDFMEASFSSLYRGMQAFLTAPKERRQLLLLQREPHTDTSVELKGNYGPFNDLVLRMKQAQDLFLIIGPPGTGKTSYALLYTVKEELLEPAASVLILAYTNRAVDEICSKLTAEGLDFIRIGNAFNCGNDYRDKLLSRIAPQCSTLNDLKSKLLNTRIIVGTTTALNSNVALLQLKPFSLAVIDEASQILEPHIIGLLSAQTASAPSIRKIVMIGDHKQLPAVVQQPEAVSHVDDEQLQGINLTDCRLSMFERLLKKYAHNPSVTYMLTRQGRMHHDISLFPSREFYNGLLKEVPCPHQNGQLPTQGRGVNGIDDLLSTRRIAFIAADTPKTSPSDKVNPIEARMIAAIVVRIYQARSTMEFDVDRTVGVIVPYRNQIAAVRKALDEYGIPLLRDITIDTVERFQGSQRQTIIYGFTVQRRYQLSFLTDNVFFDPIDSKSIDRKLNVAMTRAEEHLIMIGNPHLLAYEPIFEKLMTFAHERKSFFHVACDDFVSGNFEVVPLDE